MNSCFDERSLTLTSATVPLTQAAAEGDATAVRTLLAEGQDINVKTPRGQTPLILAAFFGHPGVVRILLEAGADVLVKDSLGLTAMEWSTRRGFPEVTQLIQNTPPPDTADEEEARREAEEARIRLAEETKGKAEQEARKRAEEEERIRAALERKQAEDAQLEAEAGTPTGLPSSTPAAVRRRGPRTWGPGELAKREAKAEAQRLADEVRTHAEEASRKKLEELRPIAEDEKPGQTISPAATLAFGDCAEVSRHHEVAQLLLAPGRERLRLQPAGLALDVVQRDILLAQLRIDAHYRGFDEIRMLQHGLRCGSWS